MRALSLSFLAAMIACAAVVSANDTADTALAGKKALMVIAPKDFRDEELKFPMEALTKKGASVVIASTTMEPVTGMRGMKATPGLLLKDARAEDYDAVVFVGGSGTTVLFDNADAHRLVRDAKRHNKILGAICLAPCILARAGGLRDKKATVFPQAEFEKILVEEGATLVKTEVVEEYRLVTANGPAAAHRFADALVRMLALPFKDDPKP